MNNELNILYEDNHLIAVVKDKGILSQAGSLDLPNILDIVKNYIKVKYNKPGDVFLGLVHRLDTNVSGVMVFAKTSKAASRLSKEIRENRFHKKYLAVVSSSLELKKEVTLTNYLLKDNVNKKAIITNSNKGKESILKYQAISNYNNLSLLDINLITGRFHQIRAQLSNINLALYGDIKYGSLEKSRDIALYAYYLKFKHPTKDIDIEIKHYPKFGIFNKFDI